MSDLKISVVLCTHNPRETYLHRVLEALRKQTLPFIQWELLFVDNGSKAPLSDRYDLSWHPRGRHIREDELGLNPARIRGIKESQGGLLVFVDDDTVLALDYLEQALVVGEKWPFVGAWCGSAVPEYETPPPVWCLDHVWRLTIVTVKEDVWSNLREGFLTMPYGAGMCIRKEVGVHYLEWCRMNRMSNALDRKGDLITGYGDVNLAHCAIDLGLGTGLSTRLHLTHLIPTSRLTLDYLVRHAEGDAASLMMFRAIRGLPVEEPKFSLPKFVMRNIYRLVSSKPREFFKIEDAHLRGLKRGWRMVYDYRKAAKIS